MKATGSAQCPDRELQTTVITGSEAWDVVSEADWRGLAESSGNVFATPEWMKLWRKYVARGESVAVVCQREGQNLGFWMFDVVTRGGLRLARLAGHGPGDELGPVCSREDLDDAARCLRQAMKSGQLPADLVLLERLPGGENWSQYFSRGPIRRESSPVLNLGALSRETWHARGTSKARGRRRRARQAFDDVGVIERIDDADQLSRALEELLALHSLRWSEGQSFAFASPLDLLHREFASTALDRGWLRLFVARIGSRPVAAWYGFHFGRAMWFYQSGRDPQDDKLSAGTLVLSEAIDCAFEDGSDEFKLLRGGDEYKSRFSDEDLGLETYLLPSTVKGWCLSVAASATKRIPGVRGFVLRRFGQA